MRETLIKTKFIDHLLEIGLPEDASIACELPFRQGYRRADLLVFDDCYSYAYEIKSDRDNLEKLPAQIADYMSAFDYLSIITTPRHLKGVRKICPKGVGVILLDNGVFREVLKPIRRRHLHKDYLTSFLDKNFLLDELRHLGLDISYKKTVQELRTLAADKITTKHLKTAALKNMKDRYLSRYEMFLNERGSVTHEEDLYLLTKQSLPIY